MRFVIGALLLAALMAFTTAALAQEVKRILFVGNSYTMRHDIPEMVRMLAASAEPQVQYQTALIARNGATLYEQKNKTFAKLTEGNWHAVVLQDASWMSFSLHGRAQMRRTALRLARAARDQGARVVFYAHWPPKGWKKDYIPGLATTWIETTYARLARNAGGVLAPVGRVWAETVEAGVTGLYARDGHHQSEAGAFAAALVLLRAIGDVPPGSTTWHPPEVTIDTAFTLRKAASD